jgi:hypothetical protein
MRNTSERAVLLAGGEAYQLICRLAGENDQSWVLM